MEKAYKNQNTKLDETIANLERARAAKLIDIHNQLEETLEGLKPKNILKSTVKEIREIPELGLNVKQLSTSLAGGYFTKKIVVGETKSTFKKIAGYLLQYGVSHFISNKVTK